MAKTFFASTLILLLASCALKPVFQKSEGGSSGYAIEDLSVKNNFRVIVHLTKELPETSMRQYGYRAIGEECLSRGFQFFDVADIDNKNFEGYCFTDSTRKSLAITFARSGLTQSPKRFIVEDLNNKSRTELQLGDEVFAISSKSPKNMAEIKSLVFEATNKNLNSIPLKILRQGKELTIAEPIADTKNASMGPSELNALRSFFR